AALAKGAMDFNLKPISKIDIEKFIKKLEDLQKSKAKELLIIEDDKATLQAIETLLKNKQVNISTASTVKETLIILESKKFDCIILDLKLPDSNGFELLKNIKYRDLIGNIPVVIYTGKELSETDLNELHKYTDSIVIKGASSEERLLDEVSLFIHSNESKLSAQQKKIMAVLHDPKHLLTGTKILGVDDDMRTTYALSRALSDFGVTVLRAVNGTQAIENLEGDTGNERKLR